MQKLKTLAPAKLNLTLRIGARRPDGFHELESIVMFASIGDTLTLAPDDALSLAVDGPTARQAGPEADNLVLKAARNLAARIPDLRTGHFSLTKNMPAGAGLGGGSSDAGAALRLLAQLNEIALDDPRVQEAARATGADVPVCLDPRSRLVKGMGDELSEPLGLPELHAMIVFPSVPVPTPVVFKAFDAQGDEPATLDTVPSQIPTAKRKFLDFVLHQTNDLAKPARTITPQIAAAEELIDETGDALLVRMTGSGSAVFAIYEDDDMADQSADIIEEERPDWWVVTATLG